MNIVRALVAALLLVILPTTLAQTTLAEPLTDEEMAALIATAEKAYEARQYAESYQTYRHELATRGDAYSQYFTGFMLQHGQGVEADPIAAAAWMKLSADQGHLPLLREAKKARKALSEADQAQVDVEYKALHDTYGDCALLAGRIEFMEENIVALTGSRVAENVSRVTVAYQFGNDLGFQQRQMRMREMLKKQKSVYKKQCKN
ncbi:MAG: hypothetical protein AB8G17_02020 [Gammaproteobacteria bacterium]